ncbi:hypothetical protein LOD99_10802 [Oopsacas minuta]|uniref:Uncharacterized protein n=1 Tax=Oopsacas minuta TaxID=111878 RepID=A0AAV7KFR8_9METZ|nr:hypothetical protein LOD99_10802 [Oopsacas minuta]
MTSTTLTKIGPSEKSSFQEHKTSSQCSCSTREGVVATTSHEVRACEAIHQIPEFYSSKIAETSGIDISMPCLSKSKQLGSNPEYSSAQDSYMKIIVIPFLDHLISDILSRFNSYSQQAAALEVILPINIVPVSCVSDIEDAISYDSDDRRNSSILMKTFSLDDIMAVNA